MNNSKIEWCHDTANIWWGCQEVHEGCDHCYARTLDNRWNGGHWGPHSKRRIVRSVWKDLARMQKVAAAAGTIRGKNGSMLVRFSNGSTVVVIGRLLRKIKPAKEAGKNE
jgi:hypothetical protein